MLTVLVFLRALEYFEGILFLTTNRVALIDSAFKSRIHLSIPYPALDSTSRKKLWKAVLSLHKDGSTDGLLSSGELESLDDEGMNGRQIKNAARIALATASDQGGTLTLEHLKAVLGVMKSFDAAFNSPKRRDMEEGRMLDPTLIDPNAGSKKRKFPTH